MSVFFYKVFHILGLMLVFTALGGMAFHVLNGGTKESAAKARKLAGLFHGVGLIVLLVSGFGMLAKLGLGFVPWVWAKILLWLAAGAIVALIWRKPRMATALWIALPLLGALGGYLAIYKPF